MLYELSSCWAEENGSEHHQRQVDPRSACQKRLLHGYVSPAHKLLTSVNTSKCPKRTPNTSGKSYALIKRFIRNEYNLSHQKTPDTSSCSISHEFTLLHPTTAPHVVINCRRFPLISQQLVVEPAPLCHPGTLPPHRNSFDSIYSSLHYEIQHGTSFPPHSGVCK